ncbi:hypothetical protein ACN20G_32710 (plasmid) [Streptomyces sp. BI20]|uniref:hypothetical protein n=1 Tax=Streptomyces sp. BI20 TaxID=3403460 RepID=UPI003C72452A
MTPTPHGPGSRMLADYLGVPDPGPTLLARYPAGRPDHARATALLDGAGELDFRHREAGRAGAALAAGRLSAAERHVRGAAPALAELAAAAREAARLRDAADARLAALLTASPDLLAAPTAAPLAPVSVPDARPAERSRVGRRARSLARPRPAAGCGTTPPVAA